ncbi:NAD(P)-dependent oxidoreductase [Caproiciproducens galactitolivorans]|uniref:NAD-dependent epimerase/dehydratase family protein n=1 Tax=Caproiciproducens galactitolivorans TaxID=642589 RepID=UPI00240A353E|nr:NAD(P)-dependent oxidoreductase [Caproiciproducens galactitolivorans]
MKKVLVTGAGGYIGRHVVSALLDMGAEVLAADFVADGIDCRAKTIQADIFSGSKTIYEDLGSPDVCVHMAWKDGFVHNSDAHMGYLSKHYEFIHNMTDGGLKQIAIMGTMHEVGYYEGAIDENTPCNPVSMYGIAKDALRRSTYQMLKDKDVVWQWLRAYYIYGDDERNHSIFSKIIQAEKAGQTEFPFNTGKNKYDFITVEELAKMIATCAMQTAVAGIINCCTGKPVSLAEKVENFLQEHHYKIKLKYGAFPDRPYDSPAIWGDDTKIRAIMSRKIESS